MLYDLNDPNVAPHDADVVLVGGGTVGLFAGVLLARNGHKVVILECGGIGHESRTRSLNTAEVVGRKHDGVTLGRARILGGTSTLWGGQLTRFLPRDFRKEYRNFPSKWPIDFEELEPIYDEVAVLLGLDASMHEDSAVWNRLKISPPTFSDFEVILTRWLKEPNLARLFERELNESPQLSVVCHANVVDCTMDAAGTAIAQLVAMNQVGHRFAFNGRYFILANGTIEISRLLLWMAHKNKKAPWSQNSWVGRSFQDHLDIQIGQLDVLNKKAFGDLFENIVINGFKYQPKLIRKSALDESEPSVACSLIFQSSLSEQLANIKLLYRSFRSGVGLKHVFLFPRHFFSLARIWLPLIARYVISRRIYSPFDKGVLVNLHCEQLPVIESEIRLSQDDHDEYGVRLSQLDWKIGGSEELTSIVNFCKSLKRDFETTGIGSFRPKVPLTPVNLDILSMGRDSYHQCGGARMAASDNHGVVDKNLKVFGTNNLYVAGAAVLPTSSFANPTFTSLALTKRLVDHLSLKLKCNENR